MGVALRLLIDASKIAILLTQGDWRRPCLMRLPRDSHTVRDDFRSARPPRGYCVPPETVLDTGDQPSQDEVTTHWRGVLHEPLVINGG
jgi:hypothetical protein